MAATVRPETGVEYVSQTSHKPLSTKAFYAKHLATALFGEAAIRHFGSQDTLSLTGAGKKFADITGLSQFGFITGVDAQDMSGTPADAAASAARATATVGAEEAAKGAANETAQAASRTWVPEFVTAGVDMLDTHVWTPFTTAAAPATAYVSENSVWMLEVGGIALVAAAINKAAQKKPTNVYVRNAASVLGGAAVVWGTKLALSYAGFAEPVAFEKTVDMGARILGTHFVLKHAAPLAQRVLTTVSKTMGPFGAPFCYEPPIKGKEL